MIDTSIFVCCLLFDSWAILFLTCSYDALHGVAGIYAKRIVLEELGARESSLLNCTPKVRWVLADVLIVR